ncbi:serine hydrolase domain-containing protein [Motilimonas pumila]|uniref:Class C beta-lactamase-related serine hydrolase n=1 Tax=Motilimonas pumila TaxID=2303987 RepID=A0A418YDQ3_9GAMM|nr:serine hydrolase [Motilimonas pumila]RJG42668.1 class C beta-lactamase-related serine hydrolase [Motilimonas pumila]
MKKTLLAFSLCMGLAVSAEAAEFQGRDEVFVEAAQQHAISIYDWDSAENSASTFPHAYKFTHSYRISRGLLGSDQDVIVPEQFKRGQLDLASISTSDIEGDIPLYVFLRDRLKNHAMVVLKGDTLLHEHYWNNMNPQSLHLDMSVTKSFTSLVAQIAVAQGKLDMRKRVIDYLPELKGSAWHTATVQQVSDMRTSLIIDTPPHASWDDRMTTSQSYNTDTGVADYPKGISDYLPLVKNVNHPMGHKYDYQCANTEVLGKVVESATGEKLADLYEQQLWQKVGLENDAYLMADHAGGAMASGGLNASTRDLARIGKMLLNDGKNYLGEQVVPKAFIDQMLAGNDQVRAAWKLSKEAALADGWYIDQFRVLNVADHQILAMVGIHGQVVAMDKASGVVIAMNGGYPQTETPRMALGIFHKVIPAILNAVNQQS